MLIKYFEKPARFEYLHKWLNRPSVKVLDVGCANNSPSRTKKHYPNCRYYGLDKTQRYNRNDNNFTCMEAFFKIDLEKTDELEKISEAFFDCIILSHIIEHLKNGEEVILKLLGKLKKGGVIYIEFPSPRSVRLPSMKGTLNFYDDATHVKIYQPSQIEKLLKISDVMIIKSGTRRSKKRMLFLPAYAAISLFSNGFIAGSVFWDIAGFAHCIIALKE